MTQKAIDPKDIAGWGADNDPRDQPNYPFKYYTGDDHQRIRWHRPPLQVAKTEVLTSTERPALPAVFGTKVPPRGLSGVLRRGAFRYSENMYRHWLILLLADRIDAAEGSLGDLLRGRIPNVFKERGWNAIARHRPWLLVRKIVVRLVLVAAIVWLIMRQM